MGTIEDYLTGSRTTYISQYEIIKDEDYRFVVDDYYL